MLLPYVLGAFTHPEELELVRDTLLATLATMAKEWRVTLQFRPTEYITSSAHTSVLHLTTSSTNTYDQHGDRIPAIFIYGNRQDGLSVRSSVNDKPNYYAQFDLPPIDAWTKLEVGQREDAGQYFFYFSVNGSEVHSVFNRQPREFHGVKVYASNPSSPAQPGSIRNLTVETKVEGQSHLVIQAMIDNFPSLWGEEVLGGRNLHHVM